MDIAASAGNPYLLARHDGKPPTAPNWFETALACAPEQRFFESHGTRIELLTWGEVGKPGLLFLPGNGAHAHWWSHIAPFFAEEWRCAAISWSGMGGSERRVDGYTVPILAQEALGAVAAAGLDAGSAPPIAIGHSMGGLIGMAAVSDGSSPFRALITIDSPIVMDPTQLQSIRARAPKARAEHQTFGSFDEGLARFRLSPPQPCANDFIVDHIARRSLTPVEDGWQWHFDPRKVTMNVHTAGSFIERLTCPIAYLYGEQSAMVTGETLTSSLAALPPESPAIGIPDAQHHVMIDQPIALVTALRALLTRWPDVPYQKNNRGHKV